MEQKRLQSGVRGCCDEDPGGDSHGVGSPWQPRPLPFTDVLGGVPAAVARCPQQMCPANSWSQAGLFKSEHFPAFLGPICQADPVPKAWGRRTPSRRTANTMALSLSTAFYHSFQQASKRGAIQLSEKKNSIPCGSEPGCHPTCLHFRDADVTQSSEVCFLVFAVD